MLEYNGAHALGVMRLLRPRTLTQDFWLLRTLLTNTTKTRLSGEWQSTLRLRFLYYYVPGRFS